jgi:acyl-coenzyme A synthetase/AMP-(fatty) acid ligase
VKVQRLLRGLPRPDDIVPLTPGNTIFSALSRSDPDKVMLVDGEISISYRQAIDRVESLAAWLGSQGVGPGDRVVIQLRKCVNEILLLYAVARVGAVFVNVHPLWSDTQLRHVVESCGAKIAFVEENRTQALRGFNGVEVVIGGETQGDQDALFSRVYKECSGNLPPAMGDPDALATIIYTSGSTGRPKGVMHSHRNLVEFGNNVATCLKNTQNDRILCVLPLSFGYGLSQLLTVANVGATLVLQKSALAADVLDAIRLHSITGLAGVPSIWRQIVEVQKSRAAKLPSLRYFTNAGDALARQVIDDIGACFPGVDLVLFYGTTETLRSTYLAPEHLQEKKGAIGSAVPGVHLFVLTEDGRPGGPGDRGVLLHRGAHTMLGYWNDPEATAEKLKSYPALTGDETLLCCTEDMVRIDSDGYLWFVGRASWMIKKNGFRISFAEVEESVGNLGVVKACVAMHHSDRSLGDDIHLVVIAKSGGPDSCQELQKVLRRNLPTYMLPREISFWPGEEFPHTPNGKLDRVKMKEFL